MGIVAKNEYANFLMGMESNLNSFNDVKEMIDLNYDDVTVDLKNYVKQVEIKSGKTLLYEWNPGMKDQPIPLYISYRHPLVKCYSIDISQTVKSQNMNTTQYSITNKNSKNYVKHNRGQGR
mgnify:CR=1 FL=1